MKKIVITGSNGLLGQSLVNLLLKNKNEYQVIGFSKGGNRSGREDFDYISIDITDEIILKKTLLEINPDAIVNTAAMTQVDDCEIYKNECDVLNVDVVKWLKEVSEIINCHLIHLSTDFIFDGKKGYYKETDEPNPLSYYGNSKVKSEEILLNSTIDFTIIRTILVYGKVYDMSRTNIVLWVKEMLENGKEITIVNDQFRMPTYVEDLALSCKISIDKKATGIYHISSNTLMSVFDITQTIAGVFGLDKTFIKPTSSIVLNQKAARPPKTGFDVSKATSELGMTFRTFEQDLQRFKDNLSLK
ncbi:MAG: SDR family oxidoreductase [Flavobacteriia bacterium]|nr:SDR family oxidoreductase [Flavobacteriia bacterium]OIP47396.1 MAG: NAD(P)-dependent oxidoreductase [Flavobacteriaceae bacterium CG2_30_31_66]PIV96694.1 MAG: NAD(P)-dependent oxidoreductase [Flavobacteriaceae bacterium CG17_big_fil_post_rev_8_21_14_2_50_31_13]PIX11890.1 MAG: NAD(P)-dependent oxidoreductase [Flavobacteriaceae bacterium CG_4_8_14_3_um_filter_31_8]PIY14059.1 MAG: NAD(P)-dependent oxidoreductase [Flavobacteriaceae bacterium CG_4_10_14_3_um_filter_31_253]PIZ09370.1 MAG: NAD(P)-d